MYNREQLCFSCEKSDGKCSWSKNFTPVDGWVAKKTNIKKIGSSYFVKECPKYSFFGLCVRCKKFDLTYSDPKNWWRVCPGKKGAGFQGYGDCFNFEPIYEIDDSDDILD